jgi:hypothetical protein
VLESRCRKLGGNVLIQGPAQGHVDQLNPPADAQNRFFRATAA